MTIVAPTGTIIGWGPITSVQRRDKLAESFARIQSTAGGLSHKLEDAKKRIGLLEGSLAGVRGRAERSERKRDAAMERAREAEAQVILRHAGDCWDWTRETDEHDEQVRALYQDVACPICRRVLGGE